LRAVAPLWEAVPEACGTGSFRFPAGLPVTSYRTTHCVRLLPHPRTQAEAWVQERGPRLCQGFS